MCRVHAAAVIVCVCVQRACCSSESVCACSVHAASVLQLTHMIVNHGGLPDGVIPLNIKMSTYWAALVHDFEHGGLNNDFLIKTGSPLAELYNDQSPLENHLCAAATAHFVKPEHFYLPVRSSIPWQAPATLCACLHLCKPKGSACRSAPPVTPCVVSLVLCHVC